MSTYRIPRVDQLGHCVSKAKNAKKFLKRRKNKLERKRAKVYPECQPAYAKYTGYFD